MRYLVFVFSFMSSIVYAQSDPFIIQNVAKWKNAEAYTLQVIENMPENKFGYKPTQEEMTFQEQIGHLSGNMLWLSNKFLTDNKADFGQKDFENKSKAEVIDLVKKSFAFTMSAFENFDQNKMNDEIEFGGQKMTKQRIFLLIQDHLTHHRAQAIVYLRLVGATPPKYIGW